MHTRNATGRSGRRFWIDPRFLIGVALVVASVVGVYAIVALADDTTEVYAARGTLTIGDDIDRSDLVVTSVRLGTTSDAYLAVDDVPEDGLIMTRSVLAGELVPVSAVGTSASARTTTVVIEVAGPLSQRIEAGSVVDLWAAPALDQGRFGAPAVLVGAASVATVRPAEGLIADRGESVELLVPRAKVAVVLQAIANDDALSIVPAGR